MIAKEKNLYELISEIDELKLENDHYGEKIDLNELRIQNILSDIEILGK